MSVPVGSTRKRYSDEELGYITDSIDLPLSVVAEHLRTKPEAVRRLRRKLSDGWTPTHRPAWTDDEVSTISRDDLTLPRMAELLPGRSVSAIASQRSLRGLSSKHRGNLKPQQVGSRKLLAKTCPNCGDIQTAAAFRWNSSKRAWSSSCKKCDDTRPRPGRSQGARDAYTDMAQRITVPLAENKGKEYVESDFSVLSDPSMTELEKALKLKRTYQSVHSAAARFGFKSMRSHISDLAKYRVIIDNPNADRVDEITAALKQEFTDAGIQFPEWDWDDEDLKETA